MARTITTSNRYGVTLTDPADNPVTIAGGVRLGGGQGQFGAGAFGLYGTNTVAWTVTNFGTVQGFVAGITLAAGGHVSNASGAQIFGSAYGIAISGAAAQVVNDGTVTGSQYYLKRDQIRTVTGYTGVGIGLTMGGSVANGGKSPTATIIGGRYGVRVTGGAGAVENSGTISAKSAYYIPPPPGVTTSVGSPEPASGSRPAGPSSTTQAHWCPVVPSGSPSRVTPAWWSTRARS